MEWIPIAACLACRTQKSVADRMAGVPGVLPQVVRPGDCISQDFLGPLVKTRRGNTYLCVLVDHFTRYCSLVPTASTDSDESARALFEGWINHFGLPRAVLHDRGSGFIARVL